MTFGHLRPPGHIMPDHGGDRGAAQLDLGASRSPPYQADADVLSGVPVLDGIALLRLAVGHTKPEDYRRMELTHQAASTVFAAGRAGEPGASRTVQPRFRLCDDGRDLHPYCGCYRGSRRCWDVLDDPP